MTLVVILDEDKQRHLVEYLLLEETTEAGYVMSLIHHLEGPINYA